MASEKQIEANRRNAQRSTGPVTPAGKAAASQNALHHGLRAGRVLFAPTDAELQDVRDGLAAEWQPQTYTEWTLIEQMVVALHQQACYQELEAEWESRIVDHRFPPALEIIWRRQAAAERSFRKALDTLVKIRKERAAERKLAASKTATTEPVVVASQPEAPPYRPPAMPEPRTLVMREHSLDAIPPAEPVAIRELRPVSAFPDVISVPGDRPTLEPAAHASQI